MKPRRQRRLPVEHVMIAAGENDLDALRALLAYMPEDVYGQVFVESGTSDDIWCTLKNAAPARMSMTRLRPSPQVDHAADSALVTKNLTLALALSAWVDEWMPSEPVADRLVQLWVGAQGSPMVDVLCAKLSCEVERL